MWKEFNCHLIGGHMLFALRNEHNVFPLRLTAAKGAAVVN
jgi:hypothetical protein